MTNTGSTPINSSRITEFTLTESNRFGWPIGTRVQVVYIGRIWIGTRGTLPTGEVIDRGEVSALRAGSWKLFPNK